MEDTTQPPPPPQQQQLQQETELAGEKRKREEESPAAASGENPAMEATTQPSAPPPQQEETEPAGEKRKREEDSPGGADEDAAPAPAAAATTGGGERHPMSKTSLCSFFRRRGGGPDGCNHGEACRYAHTEEELRPRPDGTWDPTSDRAKKLRRVSEEDGEAMDEKRERWGEEEVTFDESSLDKCLVGLSRHWLTDRLKSFLDEQASDTAHLIVPPALFASRASV